MEEAHTAIDSDTYANDSDTASCLGLRHVLEPRAMLRPPNWVRHGRVGRVSWP